MQRILGKRIFRDLKENILRYTALAALVIFTMYIVVGIIGAADTIMTGTDKSAKEHHVEDGEFTVFVPLTDKDKEELTKDGTTIEEQFSLEFTKKVKTIRVFKERKRINTEVYLEGEKAKKDTEIALERRFCEENGILAGDRIKVGKDTFTVTGIVTTPDYDAPYKELSDSQADSKNFGTAFVTEAAYNRLRKSGKADKSEEYTYTYRLTGKMGDKELKENLKDIKIDADKVEDDYFAEYWENSGGKIEELKNGVSDLYEGTEELSDGSTDIFEGVEELKNKIDQSIEEEFGDIRIDNMISFLIAKDNLRIGGAADDQILHKYGGLVAGIILIILFAYVISIFVIHSIEKDGVVIGALYSLGVKRRELMLHFVTLPVVVTFFGGVIGTLLGFSDFGIEYQMQDCYDYYSMPELLPGYPFYLIVYGVVLPPVIAAIVNFVVIKKKLSVPALKLLRNEHKQRGESRIDLSKYEFIKAFQIRQILKEGRSAIAVVLGMFISLVLVMMSLDCYVLCKNVKENNVADTKFEYMYVYKYPEKTVPEGGEEARELFGESSDYYNVVFSDKELGIDSGRLYSVLSKSQVEAAADIFIDLMKPFMITILGGSVFIFLVVMYLMMKVMIDRSAFQIAMVKIFGYRKKEIKKLYLNGNFYIIAVGALLCCPLAKWIMDKMYPMLCANVSCALDLRFPIWMYLAIYLMVFVLYFVINTLLVHRIDKMQPAEVLKNRE